MDRAEGALQDVVISLPLVVLDLRNSPEVAQVCLISYKRLPTWVIIL